MLGEVAAILLKMEKKDGETSMNHPCSVNIVFLALFQT